MKPCTSIHRFHYIHNPSIYAVQIASYRTTAGIQLHRFTFCLAFVCFARLPACLPASPVQCASARVRHNIGPLSLGIDGRLMIWCLSRGRVYSTGLSLWHFIHCTKISLSVVIVLALKARRRRTISSMPLWCERNRSMWLMRCVAMCQPNPGCSDSQQQRYLHYHQPSSERLSSGSRRLWTTSAIWQSVRAAWTTKSCNNSCLL